MYKATLGAFAYALLPWKNKTIKYSEFFVALVIQHEQRMLYIILSSVDSPAVPCFPKLSNKQHDLWKKKY